MNASITPEATTPPAPLFRLTDHENGVTIALRGGTQFVFPANAPKACDWLVRACANGTLHEPKMSALVFRYMSRYPTATFLDCGALYGYFSCLAYAISKSRARVFAFEMNPDSFRDLQAVAVANPPLSPRTRITPVNAALGDTDMAQQSVAINGFMLSKNDQAHDRVAIDFVTIDTFAKSRGIKVDIVKIDVEGYEGLVLAGASKTLRKDRSVVLLELHATEMLEPHGITRVGLLRKLLLDGFRIYFFGHQRRQRRGEALEISAALLDRDGDAYEAMGDSLMVLTSDDIRHHWPNMEVAESNA